MRRFAVFTLIALALLLSALTASAQTNNGVYLPLLRVRGLPIQPDPTATPTQMSTQPAPTATSTEQPTEPTPTATFTATATPIEPTQTPTFTATSTVTEQPANCHFSYPTVCIPPPPPDLNCPDIPFRNFTVLPPDPHNFDVDNDGIGCESQG